jgi:protein-S-isoprenylcysteine O-methyltransferase Ste14
MTKDATNGKHKQSAVVNGNASGKIPTETNRIMEFVNWGTYNLPPNIKTFKLSWYANFHKCTMLLFILGMMKYYNNFSLGCCVYAGLHGSYGFLWNMKTLAFPDKSHQQLISLGSNIPVFAVLFAYWYIAYMMATGQSEQNPSLERVFWSILVYSMGVCCMIATDAQKYFCLMHKRHLVDYGMFAHCRNPNYLGEMMLYSSFAILSNRTTPWVILLTIWSTAFAAMLYSKEVSFSRKVGWDQYQKQSYLLLFKICGSDLLSFLVYGVTFSIAIYCYLHGGLFHVLKNL